MHMFSVTTAVTVSFVGFMAEGERLSHRHTTRQEGGGATSTSLAHTLLVPPQNAPRPPVCARDALSHRDRGAAGSTPVQCAEGEVAVRRARRAGAVRRDGHRSIFEAIGEVMDAWTPNEGVPYPCTNHPLVQCTLLSTCAPSFEQVLARRCAADGEQGCCHFRPCDANRVRPDRGVAV